MPLQRRDLLRIDVWRVHLQLLGSPAKFQYKGTISDSTKIVYELEGLVPERRNWNWNSAGSGGGEETSVAFRYEGYSVIVLVLVLYKSPVKYWNSGCGLAAGYLFRSVRVALLRLQGGMQPRQLDASNAS